jgi:hypothetical protein
MAESRHDPWIVAFRHSRGKGFEEAIVESFATFADIERLQILNVENTPSMSPPKIVDEGSLEGKAEPAVVGVRFTKIDGCARMRVAGDHMLVITFVDQRWPLLKVIPHKEGQPMHV